MSINLTRAWSGHHYNEYPATHVCMSPIGEKQDASNAVHGAWIKWWVSLAKVISMLVYENTRRINISTILIILLDLNSNLNVECLNKSSHVLTQFPTCQRTRNFLENQKFPGRRFSTVCPFDGWSMGATLMRVFTTVIHENRCSLDSFRVFK